MKSYLNPTGTLIDLFTIILRNNETMDLIGQSTQIASFIIPSALEMDNTAVN